MKTGKMAVLTGVNEPFRIDTYPVLPATNGSVRLKLIASGVCGTDLHIHEGRLGVNLPAAIGHEFVGVIDDITEADSEQYGLVKGDNAIVYIAIPCGECFLCKTGDDANCVNMRVTNSKPPQEPPHFHGGYGEYTFAPPQNLIPIPKGLDPKTVAVFACAGPTSIHAFQLAAKAGGSLEYARVAVIQGLGPVGLFTVMLLSALNVPNIIALTARENEKRAKAARSLGATHVLSLEKDGEIGVLDLVMALSGGLGADLVFEASGNPAAIPVGLNLLRNRGVYLIPGQYSDSGKIPIAPQLITFKALRVLGSSQYSVTDVKKYLSLLESRPELRSKILELAAFYPVEKINAAMQASANGENIKTLLVGE